MANELQLSVDDSKWQQVCDLLLFAERDLEAVRFDLPPSHWIFEGAGYDMALKKITKAIAVCHDQVRVGHNGQ